MVTLGQKLKLQKSCQKGSHSHIRVVLGEKPVEKTPLFEKLGDFENRPSSKGFNL